MKINSPNNAKDFSSPSPSPYPFYISIKFYILYIIDYIAKKILFEYLVKKIGNSKFVY